MPHKRSADATLRQPLVEIVQRLEDAAEVPADVGTIVVIERRVHGRADAEVKVFADEACFRQWVQQLLLGNDIEQCRAMAQSYRRMEAVLTGASVPPSDLLPGERNVHRTLRRAERNGELCCGEADERWLAWYRRQQSEAWQPPSCVWGLLHSRQVEALTIENLLSPSTRLDGIINQLQWLAHLGLGVEIDSW